jgi:hypothetical protein
MAENKKSFVLYSDNKSIIDLLSNEQAGLLLKTLFAYVNDENPTIDNSIVLVFEMIKVQLKRDLKKWEQTKEGRSIAGKASAEAKRIAKLNQQTLTNSTNVDFVQQTSTNSTVSVSVSDSVNVSVIDDDVIIPTSPIFIVAEKALEILSMKNDAFAIYATRRTKKTVEQLEALKTQFITDQKALGKKTWQSEQDCKKHFIDWVNKQQPTPLLINQFLASN